MPAVPSRATRDQKGTSGIGTRSGSGAVGCGTGGFMAASEAAVCGALGLAIGDGRDALAEGDGRTLASRGAAAAELAAEAAGSRDVALGSGSGGDASPGVTLG